MTVLDLIVLAFVHGLAEVLPLDPAGHALLIAKWGNGVPKASLVPVCSASALALLIYLWRDVGQIGHGVWALRRMRVEGGARLLGKVLLAALPWVVADALIPPRTVDLGDAMIVGGLTIISALILLVADRLCMTVNRIEHLGPVGSSVLGMMQLIALIPGVGRSVVSVTMGRVMGLERSVAFRFALLAAVPILIAQAIRQGIADLAQGLRPESADLLLFALTFVFVLVGAAIATAGSRGGSLLAFAIYRLVVGGVLLALAFS